jgi:hypothetical protein
VPGSPSPHFPPYFGPPDFPPPRFKHDPIPPANPDFTPNFPPSFPPSFPPAFAPSPIDAVRPPSADPPQAPPPPAPDPVKIPTRDVFSLAESEISAAAKANIFFQEIGAIEIVNLTRRSTVEGQNQNYNIINNLPTVRREFDPTSLLTNQFLTEQTFPEFEININFRVPPGQILSIAPNGDILVQTVNVKDDEAVEVQIATQEGFNVFEIQS